MKSARALMALLAVMNLGFLVWALVEPMTIAKFVGLSPITEDAGVEVRAMYGGLIGGVGMVNLLGALQPARLPAAVWATAWSFAGIGFVRLVSCGVLGSGGWQLTFAGSELCAAVVCFWFTHRLDAPNTSTA